MHDGVRQFEVLWGAITHGGVTCVLSVVLRCEDCCLVLM